MGDDDDDDDMDMTERMREDCLSCGRRPRWVNLPVVNSTLYYPDGSGLGSERDKWVLRHDAEWERDALAQYMDDSHRRRYGTAADTAWWLSVAHAARLAMMREGLITRMYRE